MSREVSLINRVPFCSVVFMDISCSSTCVNCDIPPQGPSLSLPKIYQGATEPWSTHCAQTAGLSPGHQNIPETQALPKAGLRGKAGAVEGIEDTHPSTAGPWTCVSCRSHELSAHKAQDGSEPKLFTATIHIEADVYRVCLSRPEIPH